NARGRAVRAGRRRHAAPPRDHRGQLERGRRRVRDQLLANGRPEPHRQAGQRRLRQRTAPGDSCVQPAHPPERSHRGGRSDTGRVLPQVGSLVEGPASYPWLTGRQNLRRIDAAGPDGQRKTRAARIDAALTKVGLAAAATKRYRAYSLGMKQRLGLAAALLRPRSLLVLDEPTNGMDPQGTREIRNLVRELASEGSTVFLSTHLLSEVEQLCTHLGIISVGKVVAQGSIEDLRGRGDAMLRVETEDAGNAAQALDPLGLEAIVVTGEAV